MYKERGTSAMTWIKVSEVAAVRPVGASIEEPLTVMARPSRGSLAKARGIAAPQELRPDHSDGKDTLMLDHVFISVADVDRAIAFYELALAPLGITHVVDYHGKDGPPGHPDLKGFGRGGRVFFWLRPGEADGRSAHIGFVADGQAEVNAFYAAAMAAGATDNGAPGARLHYDPRYYAAGVFDLDGYSLEAVYKPWQHGAH